jgi:hypothetical protein
MFYRNKFATVATLGTALLVGANSAFAAAVDVSSVTTDITAQLAPIGAIGLAVLSLLVGIKTYKWVRRAM